VAVYKPRRKGAESKFYVCEFVYQGRRFQESTGATSKTVAKEYEKRRRSELERAAAGLPTEQKAFRIRSVSGVIKAYLKNYGLTHRPQSVTFAKARLARVEGVVGNLLLSDLTEDRVHDYMRQRLADGVSGRTINMELGELSRAAGQKWSLLWPKVRKLEERKDVGRALSPEEQTRLLAGLAERDATLQALIPLLLLTGMRAGEARSLTWAQVNLQAHEIRVGRAKTSSGTGRTIPINKDLAPILKTHRSWFQERFGNPKPEQHLFPWGKPTPADPARHITDITSSWDELRKQTGVQCRLHDLRHSFATQLAENDVPESTMLALMGHMSRAMLERYSHIRIAAKRHALAGVSLHRPAEDSERLPVKVPVARPRKRS